MRYCPGDIDQNDSFITDGHYLSARRFELANLIWNEIARLWPSSSNMYVLFY